jgi:hypothetical protein
MIDKQNGYIKSHIPALYFLEIDKFASEDELISDLVEYFRSRYDFDENISDDREFEKNVRECYSVVKKVLDSIEPEYIPQAIDDFWDGYPEDTIYGKYKKGGFINL